MLTAESLEKINQVVRPGRTTIRSVEETLKVKGESKEEIL